MADRHCAQRVSLRQRMTPPHESKPPGVVVVVVYVGVDKSCVVVDVHVATWAVAVMSTIVRSVTDKTLAILGTTARCHQHALSLLAICTCSTELGPTAWPQQQRLPASHTSPQDRRMEDHTESSFPAVIFQRHCTVPHHKT